MSYHSHMSYQSHYPDVLSVPGGPSLGGPAFPQSVHHSPRGSPWTFSLLYGSAGTTQTGSGIDRPNAKARQRVAIACGRCRKRKIRCRGGGKGVMCTNCAAAAVNIRGKAIQACVFNRPGEIDVSGGISQLNQLRRGAASLMTLSSVCPPTGWGPSQSMQWQGSHIFRPELNTAQADSAPLGSSSFVENSATNTSVLGYLGNNDLYRTEPGQRHSMRVPAVPQGGPPLIVDKLSIGTLDIASDMPTFMQRQAKVSAGRNGHGSSSSRQATRHPLRTKGHGGVSKSQSRPGMNGHHRRGFEGFWN